MSLDSILRATGKNLLPNPNVHAYNYSSDYKKYNNTDEIFLAAGTYSVSVNANCPTLQFWNVTTKQQYTVDEAVSAYSTNTYYKVYEGYALSRASDAVRQMWFTLKINALITLNSANTSATSQECQIEKGSTATTYEPYEYLGPKTIKIPSNGENLTPYPYADNDKTENGITFVTGYYSGIRMNGTVSSDLPIGFTIVDNLDLTVGDYTFSSGYNGTVMPNDVVVQLNYLEGTIPKGVATLSGSKLQETFSIDNTLAQKKFRATIVLNAGMSSSFSINDLLLCPTLIKSGSKEVLKVSYNSRNFFNVNTLASSVGITKSITNNTITFTSTAVNGRYVYKIPTEIGKQYTVSVKSLVSVPASGQSATGSDIFLSSTAHPDTLDYGSITSTALTKTFTATTKFLYIKQYVCYGANQVGGQKIIEELQVELGNKKTEYVPYFNTVVWTQVLTGYNITSTTNADGTQSLNIVDATSTTDHYNITSTDNSDGTQTLNITDA